MVWLKFQLMGRSVVRMTSNGNYRGWGSLYKNNVAGASVINPVFQTAAMCGSIYEYICLTKRIQRLKNKILQGLYETDAV